MQFIRADPRRHAGHEDALCGASKAAARPSAGPWNMAQKDDVIVLVRQGTRDLSGDRTRKTPSGRARGRRVRIWRGKDEGTDTQAGRRVVRRKAGTGVSEDVTVTGVQLDSRHVQAGRSVRRAQAASRPTAMTSSPWRPRHGRERPRCVSRPVEAEIPTILVEDTTPRLRRIWPRHYRETRGCYGHRHHRQRRQDDDEGNDRPACSRDSYHTARTEGNHNNEPRPAHDHSGHAGRHRGRPCWKWA